MCTRANVCRDTSGLRRKLTKISLTWTNVCTVGGAGMVPEQQGVYNRMQDDLILVSVKAVNLIQMSFFDIGVIPKNDGKKPPKESADELTPNQHMIN